MICLRTAALGLMAALMICNVIGSQGSLEDRITTLDRKLATEVEYLQKMLAKVISSLLNLQKCSQHPETDDHIDYRSVLDKLPIDALSGLRGASGKDGRNGLPGRDGRSGTTGQTGRDGSPGQHGAPGVVGSPGKKGDPGVVGAVGQQGPAGPSGQHGVNGSSSDDNGVVYTRWGRTTCTTESTLLYKGFAGRNKWQEPGGGVNTQCMPLQPEYNGRNNGKTFYGSWMSGVEYQTYDIGVFPTNPHDQNVPCARCYTGTRSAVMMIPAKRTCPGGWTKEFEGYLMAERHNHAHPTDYECVDANPEYIPGQTSNTDGGLFYFVRPQCNQAAHCPPYQPTRELTCVVCSK